ncbi:phosphate/phosphite/phosphonate ABC transporter substrate-binding protein [Agrobacterium rhizogenes]|uniref:phosphate/phosphite/phosphonate ABC transporter substrate-binding protein n=1 Tax=Rhizobium rhizogenes TaxID=359 RepID=UPI0015745A68|nr:PhnD/SsuA/transferrin family substrate-binding protein [Rhizobium rhizogenes]NTG50277.1 phosphate/phosphite/phosphonate ABC transporter substrate-binding protein [Rhizobium rhizogenes]
MTTSPPIACSRMYNLSPKITGLWDGFFTWLGAQSGIRLEVIPHAAPAPLSALWERPDMGVVFMCGFPFSKLAAEQRPIPLVAPISLANWAGGQPVYASHIAAAGDTAFGNADLAKARWGWTVRDSQSGYNAPREYLATQPYATEVCDTVGPLLNPRGVVEAILSGTIDVGAIDAYAYQLLDMHEPEMIAPLRIVATTKPAPFPLLVASRQLPPDTTLALKHALLHAHRTDEGQAILTSLGLAAFAEPDMAAYDRMPARARDTDEALGASW